MASKSRTQQKTNKEPKVRKPGTRKGGRAFAFYGRAGTGKTTLTGTFPGKTLLIDMNDRGDDSVSDNAKNIDVVDVTSTDELDDIYWLIAPGGKWEGKYDNVAIDTVTQLQQIIVSEVVGSKAAKKGKRAGDWGSMTKQDWGAVAGEMKDIITNFRDLEMNVIFLAQDRAVNTGEEDEDSGLDPEIGPRLSPSVNKHLCAAVHVIGNTFIRTRIIKKEVAGKKKPVEKEKIEYCLRVGPNSVYTTKVRKARGIVLPELIVDPTYEEIMEIIEGDE